MNITKIWNYPNMWVCNTIIRAWKLAYHIIRVQRMSHVSRHEETLLYCFFNQLAISNVIQNKQTAMQNWGATQLGAIVKPSKIKIWDRQKQALMHTQGSKKRRKKISVSLIFQKGQVSNNIKWLLEGIDSSARNLDQD